MPTDKLPTDKLRSDESDLEAAAGEVEPSIVSEFVDFLKHEKKWWLVPIIVAVLLMGVLALAAATGAAPFIYTLF